jgi:hypothetical protein
MPAQPEPTDRAEVTKLAAAVEEALAAAIPTKYNNPDLPSHRDGPQVGDTPPVPQPWPAAPPMSARATNNARVFMYCSWAAVPPGLLAIGILVASQHANPTVIGMICAAPAAIAVPILAIARLIRRAGQAAPPEIHHHYEGPVYQDQRNVQNKNIGAWVKNTNCQ